MEVPGCTANGLYSFGTVFYGKHLREWVEIVDAYVTKQSKWDARPLTPGAFGYDNFAVSIATFFALYITGIRDKQELAAAVHDGWATNYIWWRETVPQPPYRLPYTPLGDERRNMLAHTPFTRLPDDEKAKDVWVVEAILAAIK